MAHDWDDLVLGGTQEPRILKLSDLFVTNEYADEDTSGWALLDLGGSGSITLGRETISSAFSNYMFKITLTGDHSGLAYWEHDLGAAFTSKTFIVKFRARVGDGEGSQDVVINFATATTSSNHTIEVYEDVREFVFMATVGQTPDDYVRFSIGSVLEITGTIYFDQVLFAEVLDDFTFPTPQTEALTFDRVIYGRNELWNGRVQEFGARWRPIYTARWHRLAPTLEIFRQLVSESSVLFCYPHSDVDWGFFGVWQRDFQRRYFRNRFIGHDATIRITGTELIIEKPEYQSGVGGLYIEDDLII